MSERLDLELSNISTEKQQHNWKNVAWWLRRSMFLCMILTSRYFKTKNTTCVYLYVWVSVPGCGCVFEYLDPADSLLGLHHAYVLGGVPLRQQLSGAQVVSSKDNSINQVFWLAGSWDWARERNRGWWLTGRHGEWQSAVRLKGLGVWWRGYCNHCSQRAVWRNRAKHCRSEDGEMVITDWVSSEMATGCELMEVRCWGEAGLRLICFCDM